MIAWRIAEALLPIAVLLLAGAVALWGRRADRARRARRVPAGWRAPAERQGVRRG